MRVGNALLVAGIVIVIAALSGASFAADDGGRTTPGAAVVATEEATGDSAPPGEEGEPTEPADDEGDRVPDEVETEEVAPQDEPDADGDGGGKESDEKGGRERDRGEERRGDKQPLANVGVTMKNIQFKPKTVTVKPGDEVTWTNRDTAQHDAVANDGSFNTDLLSKGQKSTIPFNDQGTFKYFCSVHPSMKGTVEVRASGSGGNGDKDDTSSGTAGTSSGTGSTGTGTGTFDSGFSSGSGSTASGGGGSLPNTGQAELPLLLLGASLIVAGLLARAVREYWIWR
jgi:LPXTG-motif cell wall-anchored protein